VSSSPLVLIIDDERNLVRSLELALKGAGIETRGAYDGASGLRLAGEIRPDAVLLDLRLPDASGLEVLETLRKSFPGCPVIMISAHGDTRAAVQCVKAGASDYLTKPFDLDELVHLIGTTIERGRLDDEIAYRRSIGASESVIVGEHPAIARLRELVARVAASNARTVLLLGASGTGGRCTRPAGGSTDPSSRSTAPRCPNSCWKPNCSAPKRAPTPGPDSAGRG